MPELPEITHLASQMEEHLTGKTILGIEILQPKCLNMPEEDFKKALVGARICKVDNRGKWLRVETSRGWLLINLGMGGEILLVNRASLPAKHRIIFDFSDQTCLSINFWWFGYVHFVLPDRLDGHEMTAKLGPNAMQVSADQFQSMLAGRRGRIKSFLLDQACIAGIGNAYAHDILFLARLHPLRNINSLSAAEILRLHQGIQDGLRPSLEKGGAFYEMDLFGQKGGFLMEDILIGYKEGQPCPSCGALITKIQTGSTSSFICPVCQPLTV